MWQFTRAIFGTEALVRPVLARSPLSLSLSFIPFLFRMLSPRSAQSSTSLRTPPRFLPPFLLVLIPYSCVIYARVRLINIWTPVPSLQRTRSWDRDAHIVASAHVREPKLSGHRRGPLSLSLSLRALSRLINSQRDDISRLFPLDPLSVPNILAERARRHLGDNAS